MAGEFKGNPIDCFCRDEGRACFFGRDAGRQRGRDVREGPRRAWSQVGAAGGGKVGELRVEKCRSCGASVVWLKHERTGTQHLDASQLGLGASSLLRRPA